MTLKQPVGGSMGLLMSESLRFNWFIQTADSFGNKAFDCVNEWITESFLSTDSFKKLIHSISKHRPLLRNAKQCYDLCLKLFYVGKIEQRHAILCLKCKSLIALLNLYKMIIKCVIILISAEKRFSLCNIDYVNYIKLYKYKKHTEAFCCLQFRMPGI